MTIRKISSIVFLTAFKASDFCSGVWISPETISIIWPPNFGCKFEHYKVSDKRIQEIQLSLQYKSSELEEVHTIKMLDVDAISKAIVAITKLPASGFACKTGACLF